jgi:phosphomevalonate kinase
MIAVAPGKAVLCGEYAVLHGAPAIAVAVDRTARAQFAKVGNATTFVQQAVKHAERVAGPAPAPVVVDTAQLFEGEHKLGLGSSAAVTAATVGLVFAARDPALSDKRALFDVADAAHAQAQGTRGSGVDVACSVYGGVLRFTRSPGSVEIVPVELPDNVRLTFIWAGKTASTAELLGRIKQLAETHPLRHESAMARLSAQAHAFATAVAANDSAALVAAADAYGQAMGQLGEAAACEIVTRPHAVCAALARRHGGAAKPSGAGGGDLGVAFTVGAEATHALRADLRGAGLTVLPLGAPAPGLRLENA